MRLAVLTVLIAPPAALGRPDTVNLQSSRPVGRAWQSSSAGCTAGSCLLFPSAFTRLGSPAARPLNPGARSRRTCCLGSSRHTAGLARPSWQCMSHRRPRLAIVAAIALAHRLLLRLSAGGIEPPACHQAGTPPGARIPCLLLSFVAVFTAAQLLLHSSVFTLVDCHRPS